MTLIQSDIIFQNSCVTVYRNKMKAFLAHHWTLTLKSNQIFAYYGTNYRMDQTCSNPQTIVLFWTRWCSEHDQSIVTLPLWPFCHASSVISPGRNIDYMKMRICELKHFDFHQNVHNWQFHWVIMLQKKQNIIADQAFMSCKKLQTLTSTLKSAFKCSGSISFLVTQANQSVQALQYSARTPKRWVP